MGQTYVNEQTSPQQKNLKKITNQYHLPKHTRSEEEEDESYSK